jgi:DHA1 family tetracycline resistance protein-like MFS transporter
MAGPVLFTQVFAAAIAPRAIVHLPGAPYFVAALLLFASLTLAAYVARREDAAQPAHQTSESAAPSLDPSD